MIKIYDMETLEEREILFRGGSGADVSAPVAEILRAVQERGDAALREYTLRFDGAAPDALAVTAEEVDQAAAQVEPAFLAVLEEAAPAATGVSPFTKPPSVSVPPALDRNTTMHSTRKPPLIALENRPRRAAGIRKTSSASGKYTILEGTISSPASAGRISCFQLIFSVGPKARSSTSAANRRQSASRLESRL